MTRGKQSDAGPERAPHSPAPDVGRAAAETARRMSLLRLADGANEHLGLPAEAGDSMDSIYHKVCDSMAVGVMLLAREGRIAMLNPAGAEILGLDAARIIGRRFAEVFLDSEAFEEFNEALLAAMYEGDVGHQRVATIDVGDRRVPLSIATSYLRGTDAAERGLVALFNDITEIERLRTNEIALTRSVRDKHHELTDAYRDLETRNLELQALLRKMRAVRGIATACVAAIVLGIGAYVWSDDSSTHWFSAASGQEPTAGERRTVAARRGHIASTIRVASKIAPRREVSVASPLSAHVDAVAVDVGQKVAAGETLVELDVTEIEIQLRGAQATHLGAKARLEDLERWERSPDAAIVRRRITRARFALEASREQLAEKRFLVERGLTPAARLEAAERDVRARALDLEASEADLRNAIVKAAKSTEVAKLELANATAALERLRATLARSAVVAPVGGVILTLGGDKAAGRHVLSAGATVAEGEALATIGDMSGLTAAGWIDEIEVQRVKPGGRVRITGPGFPDVVLDGAIATVSSHALRRNERRGLPRFEITAVVEQLDEATRGAIRLGMSATMEIVVYENPEAVLLPIGAVTRRGRDAMVTVRDAKTGEESVVAVTTGATTVRLIEILEGLEAGQQVILP